MPIICILSNSSRVRSSSNHNSSSKDHHIAFNSNISKCRRKLWPCDSSNFSANSRCDSCNRSSNYKDSSNHSNSFSLRLVSVALLSLRPDVTNHFDAHQSCQGTNRLFILIRFFSS